MSTPNQYILSNVKPCKIEESKEVSGSLPIPECPSKSGISSAHELLRRRSFHYTKEIWYTASSRLNKMKVELEKQKNAAASNELVMDIDFLYNQIKDITNHILVDLDGLGRVDGRAKSRINELNRFESIIHSRLEKLQNPKNCKKAKYLRVSLNRPCGFGCNVHHFAYCFVSAYATGRTLVLSNSDSLSIWWEKYFRSLSSKCSSRDSPSIINCPYIEGNNDPWKPQAVPQDLANDLARLHGAPFVWFIGNFMKYMMTPKSELEAQLSSDLSKCELSPNNVNRSPVIGIHVRRTDKVGAEAAFHGLEEYMKYADEYFDQIDAQRQMAARSNEWKNDDLKPTNLEDFDSIKPVKRRIILATDDPNLLEQAVRQFPNHIFCGSSDRAKSAAVFSRSSDNSRVGIAIDILLLAETDYLVCTFSSQVCRIAYELMQVRHRELGDASWRFQSLDDIYYYGGQQPSPYETIIAEKSANLNPGSKVDMLGNHWNGLAMVKPKAIGSKQLLPAYKFWPGLLIQPFKNYSSLL